MANTLQFGRTDNGFGAVTPVGTTIATTAILVNGVNHVVSAAGTTAVRLPDNAAGPVVVRNLAATAVSLDVFPNVAAGIVYAGANASAGVAAAIAQNKSMVFFPHPNGLDWTGVLAA